MAEASEDLKNWAASEGLPEKTVQVLVDEDFTTLDDVRFLTEEEVSESFQKTQRLPLKQCLALKKAVARLASGASDSAPRSPPDQGAVSPQRISKVAPVPPPRPPAIRQQAEVQSASAALSAMDMRGSEVDMVVPRGSVKERAKRFDSPTTPTEPNVGQRWTSEPTTKAKESTGLLSTLKAYWKGHTEDKPKEVFRFILLGKTGSGKSTTGNTILGAEMFNAGMTFSSVTATCDLQSVNKDGTFIEIMDCPGLFDTSKTQAEISTVIVQAVACTHPGPHAILYVIRLGRFTAEEFGVYNRLKALFDDRVVDYMIILFTGGDELERSGKNFADLMKNAPKELVEVLTECKNRRVVFNNNAKNPKTQVEQLFSLVREMNKEHNLQPYTCPKYDTIGEGLEREVHKRLEEVHKRDLEREQYVQELEAKTKEAQIAVEETKREFEKKEEERRQIMEKERQRIKEEEERKREELKAMEDKLTEDKRILEESLLKERHDEEKKKLQEKLEKEKNAELERLRRKIEEKEELEEARREEEREEQRLKQEAYEEELNKFKGEIARNEDQGWVDWAAQGVASVVAAPFKAVGWLFS